MKDGEGVAEMYSRLALITNEIAGLGSEEMTDRFIIKKILRALDGKYDIVCTLILIRVQRTYNFGLFHAIILPVLDVYGLYFIHYYHFWD